MRSTIGISKICFVIIKYYAQGARHLYRYMSVRRRERMTVNHDVTGSSPVGGAKTKSKSKGLAFSFANWARKAERGNAPA